MTTNPCESCINNAVKRSVEMASVIKTVMDEAAAQMLVAAQTAAGNSGAAAKERIDNLRRSFCTAYEDLVASEKRLKRVEILHYDLVNENAKIREENVRFRKLLNEAQEDLRRERSATSLRGNFAAGERGKAEDAIHKLKTEIKFLNDVIAKITNSKVG